MTCRRAGASTSGALSRRGEAMVAMRRSGGTVDTRPSKGRARKGVWVRIPPPASLGVSCDPRVAPAAVVVPPGQGHVLGNVEFLARTADTPRFNFSIIEIVAGRELESHVHEGEEDAFYILEGELTFLLDDGEVRAKPGTFVLVPPGVRHGFRNDGATSVRMLNIHAPGGFD